MCFHDRINGFLRWRILLEFMPSIYAIHHIAVVHRPARCCCEYWQRQHIAPLRCRQSPKAVAQMAERAFLATSGTRFCARLMCVARHRVWQRDSAGCLRVRVDCANAIRWADWFACGATISSLRPNRVERQTNNRDTALLVRVATSIRPIVHGAVVGQIGAGCFCWVRPVCCVVRIGAAFDVVALD